MNSAERKHIEKQIRRTREQRNATTDNYWFDYWHDLMEHYINVLKTGESK